MHSSASSGNSATKMAGQNLSVPQFPAGTSPQRLSSTPSTDRKKVVLKPGHSLMDWIRLGRSGQDLTSVGGEVQDVSQEELAKHNKPNDAWIALRGTCGLVLSCITPSLLFRMFVMTHSTHFSKWVIGSVLHGGPIELFLVPASDPRLV